VLRITGWDQKRIPFHCSTFPPLHWL